MRPEYLLGVDIGTYSSKGVLVSTDGRVAASHVVPHGLSSPRPGYFEHNADGVWWHDFIAIVRGLLAKSGIAPAQICGVGISAIGSCVLPIDADGRPLRPAILYGIDTRASKEIAYLEKVLGRPAIFRQSGTHLSSQASGPKILWIRNNEPEIYARTRWFLTSQAYLVYKLTDVASIDIYTASGYAPLFDVYACRWYEDVARHITPPERLPQAYWSCEIVGKVSAAAARETGLASGTPVIAGTTDAAAEAISAGLAEFGDMMLMFGSSIFFIMKTAVLHKTENFWSANFLESGAYAFLGGMSTAGSLTTWFRDQFAQAEVAREKSGGENAYAALACEAAGSPAGAGGLIALPYFEGERTPLHDPGAKGVLFGLRLKHRRCDVYRAILESVGFGIRHNVEVMREEGVIPQRILAVGGGTQNPLWVQIVADIGDIELTLPQQLIGASYGDAFMAGVGVGLFKDLTQITRWVKFDRVVTPNREAHRAYARNYKIFRALYASTKSLMHDLSDSRKS
ncbi:MAG: FGGY-family carbohydrate kinase [Desulfobacterales bacterium]|nr:MAG: FGGY-family carbohydrate kinase [Desulfobacterales bacterium]